MRNWNSKRRKNKLKNTLEMKKKKNNEDFKKKIID